ncbi:hypothetical protein Acr_00g0088040 [Actinidia rufa]|uniref:Basic helix-loop-helix (BHLH) DNA-binding superfamily protein n=1 Tax=Actinidia rufa TaxID=165716 RepID=A0A7J0DY37_9ERIC|nr:hypothetical protein Acr_00g0088040 [Actinidia rufa]
MIPGGEGKDAIVILDEAISYLRLLKRQAKALELIRSKILIVLPRIISSGGMCKLDSEATSPSHHVVALASTRSWDPISSFPRPL